MCIYLWEETGGGVYRTYLNIFIVYAVSGLWHGASWNFVCWGMLHGVFYILTKWGIGIVKKIPDWVNWGITFLFLNVTWVLFRANTFEEAFGIYKAIGSFQFGPVNATMRSCLIYPEVSAFLDFFGQYSVKLQYLSMLVFIGICLFSVIKTRNVYEKTLELKPDKKKAVLSAGILWRCVIAFSGVSTFIYFNF